MEKKFLKKAGIIFAAVLAFGMISCANDTDSHEHTFDTEWTSDATNHWHAATCGHTTEVAGKEIHTFGEWKEKKPATESEEGLRERFCVVCNYKAVESIAQLEHVHTFATEWTSNTTNHYHASTCGHIREIKDNAAHTFSEWNEKKPATESEEGLKERVCTVCNYKETETIAKLGHIKGTHHPAVAATCTAKGNVDYYDCTGCSKKFDAEGNELATVETEKNASNHSGLPVWTKTASKHKETYDCCGEVKIEEAKHSFTNGTCSVCGYVFDSDLMINIPASEDLEAFMISNTELTYGKWYEVYQWAVKNGYTFQNLGKEGNSGTHGAVPSGSKKPVTCVSWRDALVWCNAASQKEGLTPVYHIEGTTDFTDSSKVLKEVENYGTWGSNSENTIDTDVKIGKAEKAVINTEANGYRLPTEAEWEYAAKGGQNYTYSGSDNINDVAWYFGNNTTNGPRDAGLKEANGYGLYDMSGNVAEWCYDTWLPDYTCNRVTRGGWSGLSEDCCTVSYRDNQVSYDGISSLGFRVVRNAQ